MKMSITIGNASKDITPNVLLPTQSMDPTDLLSMLCYNNTFAIFVERGNMKKTIIGKKMQFILCFYFNVLNMKEIVFILW